MEQLVSLLVLVQQEAVAGPVMTVEVLGMGLLVDPAVAAIMMVLVVLAQPDKVIMVVLV